MVRKATIDNDLKAALLGGDRFRADVLRGLKAAILNEEVAKGVRDTGLDDGAIEQLIAREVKKRLDSATQYEAAGRPELVEAEKNEAAILEAYLPAQLSEDEIRAVVTATISELGVSGPQAMGQVIGAIKAKLGTSADGATLARIVKDALAA